MDVVENMDEIQLWCNQRGVHGIAASLKTNGVDEVKILLRMKRNDLKECGLNLGQCIKMELLFEEEEKAPDVVGGNVHYLRRSQRRGAANGGSASMPVNNDNGWNNESLVNGKFRIKYTGPPPSINVYRDFRDYIFNIALLEWRTTNVGDFRVLVDRRTKNGIFSQIRYQYNEYSKTWPNAPLRTAYACCHSLIDHGVGQIHDEEWKEKSYGGFASWKGTFNKIKLSIAWNEGTPEERRELDKFIKERKKVKWAEYAQEQGDLLNCMAIGLVGSKQPQYELNLDQLIADQSQEQE